MSLEAEQKQERLHSRMDNMFARGTLHDTTPAGTQTAKVSMMADETNEGVEFPQDYGFISRPPDGSEVIVMHFGGERDHASVLKSFHKAYAPKTLQKGESALYHRSGSIILMKADGSIEATSTVSMKITTPTLTLQGDLVVTGDITDKKSSMQTMRDDYNEHTHGGGATPIPQMI